MDGWANVTPAARRVMQSLRGRGYACRSGGGDEIWVCCPFCTSRGTTPDRRYRLGVHAISGLAHCFNCRWRAFGTRTFTALRVARPDTAAVAVPVAKPPPKPSLPGDFEPLAEGGWWQDSAVQYLRDRRVSLEQARRHGAGLSLAGRFHHRIVFPIRRAGKLMGCTGRSITEAVPKWLHSRGLKGSFVACPPVANGPVVVTEGVFDALAVARASNYRLGSVAILGTKLTADRYADFEHAGFVLLWMDPDAAGRNAVRGLGAMLADQGHTVRFARSAGDPGSMTNAEIAGAAKAAIPWTADAAETWAREENDNE